MRYGRSATKSPQQRAVWCLPPFQQFQCWKWHPRGYVWVWCYCTVALAFSKLQLWTQGSRGGRGSSEVVVCTSRVWCDTIPHDAVELGINISTCYITLYQVVWRHIRKCTVVHQGLFFRPWFLLSFSRSFNHTANSRNIDVCVLEGRLYMFCVHVYMLNVICYGSWMCDVMCSRSFEGYIFRTSGSEKWAPRTTGWQMTSCRIYIYI